ncbi:MAG: MATE family efflux transporter [Pseudomonadota bacterium]
MISNATVPILGAVDTGVVGQMGDAAPIGAVGIGAISLSALYWVFGFLRMGTVGLTAQALGNADQSEVAALLTRGLIIGVGGGITLMLLQLPLFFAVFWISSASAEVESLARDYMQIRIWSAPAIISLYAITGWLIAQERTRAVLLIQLWMNGLNMLLDLWFALGLDWGVQGVALATFLAEWSGALLGLWLCRAVFVGADWRRKSRVFEAPRWRQMAQINADILIRSLLLEAIFLSFMFLGADFGDATLAANQVLLHFIMVTSYALDGFAFSAEAIVGQAFGAKRKALLRRGALISSYWAFGMSVMLGLAFLTFGEAIIAIMAKDLEVQALARAYLPYLAAMPMLSCAAFMFDGIFVGATRARDMRNMMVLSFGVYVVALAALLPHLDNHGLWSALLIAFVARGVTLGLRYPALERALVKTLDQRDD